MASSGFDISGLQRLKTVITNYEKMRPLYERWGVRYLSAMRRKFIENSAGGGDWPPLKTATIYSRMLKAKRLGYARKRGIKGRLSILRDTGTLLRGLDVRASGNLFEPHSFGIRVGYGGMSRHPNSKFASISEIASFHNEGAAKLPRRRIIWPPDSNVTNFMLRSFKEHFRSLFGVS